MRRKKPTAQLEKFRQDRTTDLTELARKAMRWAADNEAALKAADPEIPEGISDRAADNVRILLAIADVAQGGGPERARRAVLLGNRRVPAVAIDHEIERLLRIETARHDDQHRGIGRGSQRRCGYHSAAIPRAQSRSCFASGNYDLTVALEHSVTEDIASARLALALIGIFGVIQTGVIPAQSSLGHRLNGPIMDGIPASLSAHH